MRRLFLLTLTGLAGCTQTVDRSPSLLPRPIEAQSTAEPVRPVPQATPDAALDSKIAQIVAQLDSTRSRFAEAAQNAEAKIAVARGLAEGSEAWLDAHSAMSGLESLRTPTLDALSELDRLVIDRGQAGQPPYPALEAASEKAQQLATEQDDRIHALEAALAGA